MGSFKIVVAILTAEEIFVDLDCDSAANFSLVGGEILFQRKES
jgi:hypothetical protein